MEVRTPRAFRAASIAFAALLLPQLCPAQTAEWRVGDPIIAYWNGPWGNLEARDTVLTESLAALTVRGGFNLVWVNHPSQMPIAEKYGLRAQLVIYNSDPLHLWFYSVNGVPDPDHASELAAFIDAFKASPLAYSYYIIDEPRVVAFASAAAVKNYLRGRDPTRLGYIDLFPPDEAVWDLCGGAASCPESYDGYLTQYLDTVQPKLLGFNSYNLFKEEPSVPGGDQRTCAEILSGPPGDRDSFLYNFKVIANAAKARGIPFIPVVQGSAFERCWVNPDAAKLRFLSNTTLAFGAAGVIYWQLWTLRDPSQDFGGIKPLQGGPNAGADTGVFTALQEINPRYFRTALELQKTHWISTHVKGYDPDHQAYMMTGVPPDASIRITDASVPDTDQYPYGGNPPLKGILTGYFGPTGVQASAATHLYAVNLDYSASRTISVTAGFPLSKFDASRGLWSDCSPCTIPLDPGAAVLIAGTSVVRDYTRWLPAMIGSVLH